MSKMLKLLEKAREAKNDTYSMEVTRGLNYPSKNSEADHSAESTGHDSLGPGNRTLLIMIFFICVIAFASLYVSYLAMVSMEKSDLTRTRIFNAFDEQSQKLAKLESLVVTEKHNMDIELLKLKDEFGNYGASLKPIEDSLQSLEKENAQLKSSLKDLKVSDQLMLQKIIDLKSEIQKSHQRVIIKEGLQDG